MQSNINIIVMLMSFTIANTLYVCNLWSIKCYAAEMRFCFSAANMASIDTYTTIGITIVISFVVFFSLGVLVAICIGCMVKTRSKFKVTLPHPVLEPSMYEIIETDQKKTTSMKIEANSAYGTAEYITCPQLGERETCCL